MHNAVTLYSLKLSFGNDSVINLANVNRRQRVKLSVRGMDNASHNNDLVIPKIFPSHSYKYNKVQRLNTNLR